MSDEQKFEVDALLAQMMREILTLKAEVKAQSGLIAHLCQGREFPPFPEGFPEYYRSLFVHTYESLLASHPWLDGYWRDRLESELGL